MTPVILFYSLVGVVPQTRMSFNYRTNTNSNI